MSPEKQTPASEPKKSPSKAVKVPEVQPKKQETVPDVEQLQKELDLLLEKIGDQDDFEGLTKQEYENKYNEYKKELTNFQTKLVAIEHVQLSPDLEQKKSVLIESFNSMANNFNGIPKPEKIKQKNKVKDLGDIKPKIGGNELMLSAMEITGIKCEKYLAKSGTSDYYLVSIPGKGNNILRVINGDEKNGLALLNVGEDQISNKVLSDRILSGEITSEFNKINIKTNRSDLKSALKGAFIGNTAGSFFGTFGIGTGSLIGGVMGLINNKIDFTTKKAKEIGLYKKLEVVKSYCN